MVRKPRILLTVILLVALAAADIWFAGGRVGHWVANRTAPILQPAVAALGYGRAWSATFFSRGDLTAENLRLRVEMEELRAAAADADVLRDELEFTRAATGIRERFTGDPIAAGIFSWYRAGSAVLASINRGETDGIAVGDVVISATGSLVGVVREVYGNHATITILGDPNLQAAARIMGKGITGLVRTGEEGLVLDLVQKEESVEEGDTVLTGGNDHFPAGLVIGTVRSVDIRQQTLFSIIRIQPAVIPPLSGSVLVLRL